MLGLELLQQCAPLVAPVTMAAIVQAESGGWPWTIDDDTGKRRYYLQTQSQAIAMARALIGAGHNIDMGLGQVNSGNLGWLKVPLSRIFDPCTNLEAAQRVLLGAWKQADGNLPGALQAYNSGKPWGDGRYARVVYRQAGTIVPAIPGGKLAPWAGKEIAGKLQEPMAEKAVTLAAMPPVRLRIEWRPAASPLEPNARGLAPKW